MLHSACEWPLLLLAGVRSSNSALLNWRFGCRCVQLAQLSYRVQEVKDLHSLVVIGCKCLSSDKVHLIHYVVIVNHIQVLEKLNFLYYVSVQLGNEASLELQIRLQE